MLSTNNTSKLEKTIDKIVKKRLDALKIEFSYLLNPDTCPKEILPYLAYYVRVFLWDTNWTTARKREVIKWTVEVRKRRGTIYALEEGMKKLDLQVEILPWWKTKDTENETKKDFLVLATANENPDAAINAEKEQMIRDVATSLKPFSATFEQKFYVSLDTELEVYGFMRMHPIFSAYCEIEVDL